MVPEQAWDAVASPPVTPGRSPPRCTQSSAWPGWSQHSAKLATTAVITRTFETWPQELLRGTYGPAQASPAHPASCQGRVPLMMEMAGGLSHGLGRTLAGGDEAGAGGRQASGFLSAAPCQVVELYPH
jgi:hypothetical protein